MRQILSKLETSIMYHIDTGRGRRCLKNEVLSEGFWTVKEIDQAIKGLRLKKILRYEDKGTFLIVNFARHHGMDIKFDQELNVYTYEDGK
jgi:hypothetical protein